MHLPETVAGRPQQRSLEFQVDAVGPEGTFVVTAQLGPDSVQETLTVTRERAPALQVPGPQAVQYGTEIRFPVSAAGSAATVSAGPLPAGAYFDSAAGEFRWTPDASQLGSHVIDFAARDAAGDQAAAAVAIAVGAGEPQIAEILNAASLSRDAACSPGARAVLKGRWLTAGTDAGTRVWANGILAPILAASPAELQILCPDVPLGSEVQFVVQTGRGFAAPVQTTARSAAPGIFSLDGSGAGQGWIVSAQDNQLAMIRNSRLPSHPVVPGDRVLLYATGIDRLSNLAVHIGECVVGAQAITPVPNQPGLSQVAATVPEALTQTGDLPLWLSGETPDGARMQSNTVSIAIESGQGQ